jgi:hypothetical protein
MDRKIGRVPMVREGISVGDGELFLCRFSWSLAVLCAHRISQPLGAKTMRVPRMMSSANL